MQNNLEPFISETINDGIMCQFFYKDGLTVKELTPLPDPKSKIYFASIAIIKQIFRDNLEIKIKELSL